MTVESRAKHKGDGKAMTPRETLEDALNDIGKVGALKDGKKVLVLALDTGDDDKFQVSWYQAGMNMSQCLTLAETAKQCFLREMDFALFSDDLEY